MSTKKELRFRQIHLDFHTSPCLEGIGEAFDKKLWQERLQMAHVDSITCFSSGHHGWSFHPTEVGQIHPGLKFNLLRAQIEASHEIDVNVPIYLTAGVNNRMAELEPGWREVTPNGEYGGWTQSPLKPGFKTMCFNSPYLDYLCRQIEEAARMFPDADGMFFDIISQGECCCAWCMRDMEKEGYDPTNSADRKRFARRTLVKYLKKATEAARCVNPDWNVFHNNGGLLTPGNRDLLPYFSHLELESLPTGGWGYDHYPLLAAFCRNLKDYDFMGMTGKFHTTWGEFGGFKHPNALRYECAAMLAQGSKCSIGDQLHPCGLPDESTYRIIGEAYKEVEAKEPWCRKVTSCATVALLSNRGFNNVHQLGVDETAEIGVSRLLLECHIPFDRLDVESDINAYKVLILADDLRVNADLQVRLEAFLKNGGKIIASGSSILKKDSDELFTDLPVTQDGMTDLYPNYIECDKEFAPEMLTTPFVMYHPSLKIKTAPGARSLGKVYDPYFVRAYNHFSSHQHTPNKTTPSGYDAGFISDNVLYFAHDVFTLYALYGNVMLKQFLRNAMTAFMEKDLPFTTNLPSQGRATLMLQKEEKRYVAHALYANTILRGMNHAPYADHTRATQTVEVIEELNPCNDVTFSFRVPEKITSVTLEPQGKEIPFEEKDSVVTVHLDSFTCHQMIVLHF